MQCDKPMGIRPWGYVKQRRSAPKFFFAAAINIQNHIATPCRHGSRNTRQCLVHYISGRSRNTIRCLPPHDLSLVQAIRNSTTNLPMSQCRASLAIGRERCFTEGNCSHVRCVSLEHMALVREVRNCSPHHRSFSERHEGKCAAHPRRNAVRDWGAICR
jgi:hypothetical protein